MLPILFQNDQLTLYSYPLVMGLAWGIGYQYFFHRIAQEDHFKAQVLFWGTFVSAWVGAKLLFIMTSADKIAHSFFSTAQFWMGGGFVFYGGLIGGILFFLTYLKVFGIKKEWIKRMVIALTLGHGLGRIGCLLAGCCYGAVTDWWWGIHLHQHDRHPTQLLEALALLALSGVLMKIKKVSTLLSVYCLSYGLVRFLLEMLRGDSLRGQWASFTPSQWISLFLVILGAYLWMPGRRWEAK